MTEQRQSGDGRPPTNDCVRRPFDELSAGVGDLRLVGSTSQQAYDAILWGIQTGVLPSETRLPEIPLSRAIGMGRTPVREALMRLEADGFVVNKPRVGLVVAGNTLESLGEIYEVREVLEAFAARLAARYARPSDLLAIRHILEESEEPTRSGDVMRLRELNSRFHQAIHLAARNDQLRRVLHRLLNLIRLSPVSVYSEPSRVQEAFDEHWQIYQAIADREEELAAQLAGEHKRRDKAVRLAQMAKQPTSVGGGRHA